MATPNVGQLREQVRGQVVTAEDGDYEEARRVYNAMIDRRPRVIVRCAGTDDVAAAVNFARESGLDLAVRGGSHSVPGFGTADEAVVIDLSRMQAVDVDAGTSTARAQGGATWGAFNDATHAHGLATTGGIISTTGIGGLTLGGGIGYLSRGFGLSCDNLLSAEVVTADGRTLRVSDQENEDLFWAIRGGGGNFGVATSLEYQLHPVGEIYGGPMLYELHDAATVLTFYREFIQDAPEEFGGFPAWQIAPPLPFIPEDRHGDTFLVFVACWAGPVEEGEAALQPFREVAPVVAEGLGAMPYPALNSAFDALVPPGLQHYWKANFVKELTDEAIAAHLEHGPKVPVVNSTVHIYPINGACHRVGLEETAFAYRDATFATVIAGMWPDPTQNEANIAWVRDFYDATAPHSEEGGYVNFMADDDQDRIKANYRQNYDRLVDVKRKYDPDNLFHLNQNIKP
ncbi:MAG TPA: FAD-binding oxidoreductase [Solirubrobacteraceae bacterium]|nr:FAD-binding oxidoreductase [Solirubrobacteraceae bacterium]